MKWKIVYSLQSSNDQGRDRGLILNGYPPTSSSVWRKTLCICLALERLWVRFLAQTTAYVKTLKAVPTTDMSGAEH